MSTNSETILSTQTHPGDSSVLEVTSDAFRGDGYYSRADGFHTFQISTDSLSGTIVIQATLSIDPQEADWFSVYTQTYENSSASELVNITGNYVFVRAVLTATQGTLRKILLNH